MAASDSPPESAVQRPRRALNDWLLWLVGVALCAAVMTGFAARMPARFKLLGLFPIGLGVLFGLVAARLREMTPRVPLGFAMGTSAALMMAVSAAQTMLIYERERSRIGEVDPAAMEVLSNDSSGNSSPFSTGAAVGLAGEARERYLEEQGSFEAYLEKRLKLVSPEFRQYEADRFPWGKLLWTAEFMLSGTAAAVCIYLTSPKSLPE